MYVSNLAILNYQSVKLSVIETFYNHNYVIKEIMNY